MWKGADLAHGFSIQESCSSHRVAWSPTVKIPPRGVLNETLADCRIQKH